MDLPVSSMELSHLFPVKVNIISTSLSLVLFGLVTMASPNLCFAQSSRGNFAFVASNSASSSSNDVASNFMILNQRVRNHASPEHENQAFRSRFETIVVDPDRLTHFVNLHSLKLMPKYLIEGKSNGVNHSILIGVKNAEVWKYDTDQNSQKLTFLGAEKHLNETDRSKIEAAVLNSRFILMVEPVKNIDNSVKTAAINQTLPSYSVLKTPSALFNVEMNSRNEATISQIGLRSFK
jgi:hypothetical protein